MKSALKVDGTPLSPPTHPPTFSAQGLPGHIGRAKGTRTSDGRGLVVRLEGHCLPDECVPWEEEEGWGGLN